MKLDENFFNQPLLIAGLVRNGAANIESNISKLNQAVSRFSEVHWLIVESDSSDDTVEILRAISKNVPNFRFLSLGNLTEKMPPRTERLAFCRNTYLQELKQNTIYKNIEYVIVSDLDDTNTLLTEESLLSCWHREDWDVCTANQLGPYYDIWTLRHHLWSPGDCWLEHRFLSQFNSNHANLTYACVYSKMIVVPPDFEWLEVDSAFGGLAIYKKSMMIQSAYVGLYGNGVEICEHIPLNFGIREQGGKIFINPRLINTDYTEHSLPLKAIETPK
ncbi:hypothetical protein ICN42_03105 [Polynucleobacter sp. 71A-WALBACH]|uniref:glycosyltransferase family 2 protein n=1 Tax=Polynucleobacter sp. 71A-WALBACH TaxID=2689097 RepID=UPI001C0DAFB4|nr:hypothetical protein [Polynucleobacter sp. 71A-WALBACH]MBU3593079.1 hypothetical protein [Polynucleobacter sp. 71A-WALBACH]